MFVPSTYDINVEEWCWPFNDAMLNVFVLAFKCLNTHGNACCTFVYSLVTQYVAR